MSEGLYLKPLRSHSKKPTTQHYLQVVEIMREHPDPATLDERVSTLDLKNLTKTVSTYTAQSPEGYRLHDADILKAAHAYCIAGINRIENGKIFLEYPNIDVPSVQKMLPHFWCHAADFTYKLWKTTKDPACLDDALVEVKKALTESLEEDITGRIIALDLKSLILKTLYNRTNEPDYLAERINTNLEFLSLPSSKPRQMQALRLFTAKEALHLASRGRNSSDKATREDALENARIAYALFATHRTDRSYDKQLFDATEIIADLCPEYERQGMTLRKLEHLKAFMHSLNTSNHGQAITLIPVLKNIALELEEAGHDVCFDTGLFVYELVTPSDPKYSSSISDVTTYMLRSYRLSPDKKERIRRLEKTIEICKAVISKIDPRNVGFIEFSCGKAHQGLGNITKSESHRKRAVEWLELAGRSLIEFAPEESQPTLNHIEMSLRELTKKKTKKGKRKGKPKPDTKHRKYSRREHKITDTEMHGR